MPFAYQLHIEVRRLGSMVRVGRRAALATAAGASLAVVGLRVTGVPRGIGALFALDDASSAYTTTTLTRDDLLAYDKVCAWVADTENVADCYAVKDARLNYLVPSKIEVRYRSDLLEGSIGAAAAKGYIAYNMVYNEDDDACSASWFIIMSMKGVIKTIVPLKIDGEVGRAAGLKNWNDDYLLFAGAKQMKFGGNAYKMDWKTGDYDELCDAAVDIHDVQRSTTDGSAIWYPKDTEYRRANVDSGEVTLALDVPSTVEDLNHVQVLADDEYAIFSSRLTNSIIKGKAKTGELVWELGGDDGEFSLTDLDGYTYAAGHSYWKGQHNAEYIGEDQYALFDNNYDHETAGSRLLVVQVDEDAMSAEIVFEYATGTYTKVGGDNDLVPTGNYIATWWQSEYYTAADLYDSAIVEVTTDSEVAFEAKFYSDRSCADDECSIDDESWYAYSVERFYEYPIAYSVSCVEASTLSFTAHDTHKSPSETSGTYKIYDAAGTLQTKGDFDFAAHWRPQTVDVSSADIPSEGTLLIVNQYGATATETFTC